MLKTVSIYASLKVTTNWKVTTKQLIGLRGIIFTRKEQLAVAVQRVHHQCVKMILVVLVRKVRWPIRVRHVSFIDIASASKKVKTFTYLPAAS